jgi:hypothetical protein
MKKFFKVTGMILMAAVLFGAGYFIGRLELGKANALLAKARSEMAEMKAGMEREAQHLRMRIHLGNARDRLTAARTAAAERNFGIAQKELQKAREELDTAQRLADPKLSQALSEFEEPLAGLIASAGRPDPKLLARVDALRSELDQATGQ